MKKAVKGKMNAMRPWQLFLFLLMDGRGDEISKLIYSNFPHALVCFE